MTSKAGFTLPTLPLVEPRLTRQCSFGFNLLQFCRFAKMCSLFFQLDPHRCCSCCPNYMNFSGCAVPCPVSAVLLRPASRCSSCWRCPAWCNPNCRSRDGWMCYLSWDVVLIIPISLVFIHLDVRTGRANYGYEAMSVMRFQWASG